MRTPQFLDTIHLPAVTNFHIQRLKRIEAEDFGPVCAKVKADMLKAGNVVSDDWLKRGILALQQYYAIAVLDPLNQHAVSDVVDPFWHAHILHTKQYIAFCDEVTGGYIHHTPLNHEKTRDVDVVGALYDYTSSCYQQFFAYVDAEFFPDSLPSERRVCMHMDVRCETVRKHALRPFDAGLPHLAT